MSAKKSGNPAIRGMTAYMPAPRLPGFISLDANESPFDVPESLRANFLRRVKKLVFNRYPDGPSTELRIAVGKKLNLPPDWIVAGNGSDELIGCLIDAFVPYRGTVVVPDPTFVMYERLARVRGARVAKIPLGDDFDLTRDFVRPDLLRTADLWFFAYPNNPTANCFSRKMLSRIVEKAKGIVVIDEAYVDFSRKSFLPQLRRKKNLVILRTFSKALGIALGRVGLALAHPEITRAIHVVRLPYNLSGLSQALALTTVASDRAVQKNISAILSQRDALVDRLRMPGSVLAPFHADANFVLARAVDRRAPPKKVFEFLRSRDILIKIFHEPRLDSCVRITVGRRDEMRALSDALDELERSLCHE